MPDDSSHQLALLWSQDASPVQGVTQVLDLVLQILSLPQGGLQPVGGAGTHCGAGRGARSGRGAAQGALEPGLARGALGAPEPRVACRVRWADRRCAALLARPGRTLAAMTPKRIGRGSASRQLEAQSSPRSPLKCTLHTPRRDPDPRRAPRKQGFRLGAPRLGVPQRCDAAWM